MKDPECIPYAATGYFSPLIQDYLAQAPKLRPFYEQFPLPENFAALLKAKAQHFGPESRERLVGVLRDQYAQAGLLPEPEAAWFQNIEALAKPQTYTITTGHQLSLLTGPLYFVYKIVTTLKMAAQLAEHHPQHHFVPVFWMASEDHDFEEINHVHLYGGTCRWDSQQAGAVGRMSLEGLAPLLEELAEHLGPGAQAAELMQIFREAYLGQANLASATRLLVHRLFSQYGLVIIDGDDARLKRAMLAHFKADLFEQRAYQQVKAQSEALAQDYFSQVSVREINLFYLWPGHRERIERRGDAWVVLNSEIRFSASELEAELAAHPERFSPNVVLRPLYQEEVLPNLGYIGGGGEIAYWLQLKSFFEASACPFPALVLRNSVLWVEPKWQHRSADLSLEITDFFQPLSQLQNDYVAQRAPVDPSLAPYVARVEAVFDELESVAQSTDASMMGAVKAQRQKQLNGLENLRKKLLRAEKRRRAEDMDKMARIHQSLFPKAGLQERHDSLAPFYAAHGSDFIAQLYAQLEPFDYRFRILRA